MKGMTPDDERHEYHEGGDDDQRRAGAWRDVPAGVLDQRGCAERPLSPLDDAPPE